MRVYEGIVYEGIQKGTLGWKVVGRVEVSKMEYHTKQAM